MCIGPEIHRNGGAFCQSNALRISFRRSPHQGYCWEKRSLLDGNTTFWQRLDHIDGRMREDDDAHA